MNAGYPVLVCLLALAIPGCSSQPTPECKSDSECQSGTYCRYEACVYDCTTDRECPGDYYCDSRGRCQEGCSKTNGGVEACDGLDNDCDGDTDNGFDNLGNDCDNQGCQGVWVCSGDLQSEICNAPDPADDDTCDGVDNDCDGDTDEDVDPVPCPRQEGICAGVQDECFPDGSWSGCDYGPAYTEDVDSVCDQQDNDCDGDTDEDAAFLLVPENGEMADDGTDNNCNGLVDEAGGVMVPLVNYPYVWIDAYEVTVFDSAGCDGTRYGEGVNDYPIGWPVEGTPTETLYACSLPDLVPSGYLSWFQAKWACEAQGKQLCPLTWWGDGCTGGTFQYFPYGSDLAPGICNDPLDGPGQAVEAGSYSDCTGGTGTFDMSGNLAEWVEDWSSEHPGNALTGGFHGYTEICDEGDSCVPLNPDSNQHLNILSHSLNCLLGGGSHEVFHPNQPSAYLGTRCCLEVP